MKKQLATCPLCLHKESSMLFKVDERTGWGEMQIQQCKKCDAAWTHPLPEKEEIAGFYPGEYHGTNEKLRFHPFVEFLVKTSRRKRALKVLKTLKKTPGRVLDIGCGRGWMLSILKEKGHEVQGTELSEESSCFAIEVHGVDVHTKEVHECNFPSNYFDTVTIWHVLEHLHDPSSVISEIQRVLKKGGTMIVAVPNFGGIQAKLFKNRWFHLDVPRHLYHFSDTALMKLIEGKGLKVVSRRNISIEYDLFGFMQSCLNFICFNFDYLYNLIRREEGKMSKAKGFTLLWDLPVTLILSPFLFILAALFVPFTSMIGKGGTIELKCINQ